MNVQTGPAVQTEAEKKDNEFILLKSGVMVLGSELIGAKLTAILAESINLIGQRGLACIVLRDDNYPQDSDGPVFGSAYADTYSVAINLEHCWESALETAGENNIQLSLLGVLWVNLLSAIGHELDHIDIGSNDRELYELMRSTEEGCKDLEKTANDEAQKMILKLAKSFDIEPPSIHEMGWFAAKFMDLFTNDDTKELEWVLKAQKMIEEGVIYAEPDNDIEIKSFREFVKLAHDPEGDDWEQPTTCVNLEVHLDNGVVEEFKAEPVATPEAETVDIEDAAPIEAVEAPAEMIMAVGQFIGAGTTVGNEDEPDIMMDENEETAPAARTTVGTQEYVNAHAQPGDTTVVIEPAPLPAPVAAQHATLAAAAATGVPPAKAPTVTYTPHNIPPAAQAACMKAVWQTCYAHIFSKCGWQQNPTTGRFFFANAAAVLEGVNLQHIITQLGAEGLIQEYDTVNAQGQYSPEKFNGMLRGKMTSGIGLPSYVLYLNINGQRIKRSFLPQNPEKMTNNAYTKSADEAAGGNMIAWVFKDEVADSAPFSEKCAATIKNNVYEIPAMRNA